MRERGKVGPLRRRRVRNERRILDFCSSLHFKLGKLKIKKRKGLTQGYHEEYGMIEIKSKVKKQFQGPGMVIQACNLSIQQFSETLFQSKKGQKCSSMKILGSIPNIKKIHFKKPT